MESFLEAEFEKFKRIKKKSKKVTLELTPAKIDFDVINNADHVEKKKGKTKGNENGSIISVGLENSIIVISVENKDDSIHKFTLNCNKENISLDTFAIKTINKGFYYFYRITDEQCKQFEKITSVNGIYDLNVSIVFE